MMLEQTHPAWMRPCAVRLVLLICGIAGCSRKSNPIMSYAHLSNACWLMTVKHC